MQAANAKTQQPLEMVKDLAMRSKLQTATVVGFVLSLIFMMFMPWLKLSAFGFSESGNFFEIASLSDIIVLVSTIVGLSFSAMVVYQVKTGAVKHSAVLNAVVAAGIAAIVNILISTISILSNNENGVSVGFGYYGFVLINLAILVANGMKAMKHQAEVMAMFNKAKSLAETKAKEMQNSGDKK